ncbi:MAG: hypothetical protein IPJ34_09070 [Myxococcales bacterium]|nr:hypothetical protein [Myxococcales bacterium]
MLAATSNSQASDLCAGVSAEFSPPATSTRPLGKTSKAAAMRTDGNGFSDDHVFVAGS